MADDVAMCISRMNMPSNPRKVLDRLLSGTQGPNREQALKGARLKLVMIQGWIGANHKTSAHRALRWLLEGRVIQRQRASAREPYSYVVTHPQHWKFPGKPPVSILARLGERLPPKRADGWALPVLHLPKGRTRDPASRVHTSVNPLRARGLVGPPEKNISGAIREFKGRGDPAWFYFKLNDREDYISLAMLAREALESVASGQADGTWPTPAPRNRAAVDHRVVEHMRDAVRRHAVAARFDDSALRGAVVHAYLRREFLKRPAEAVEDARHTPLPLPAGLSSGTSRHPSSARSKKHPASFAVGSPRYKATLAELAFDVLETLHGAAWRDWAEPRLEHVPVHLVDGLRDKAVRRKGGHSMPDEFFMAALQYVIGWSAAHPGWAEGKEDARSAPDTPELRWHRETLLRSLMDLPIQGSAFKSLSAAVPEMGASEVERMKVLAGAFEQTRADQRWEEISGAEKLRAELESVQKQLAAAREEVAELRRAVASCQASAPPDIEGNVSPTDESDWPTTGEHNSATLTALGGADAPPSRVASVAAQNEVSGLPEPDLAEVHHLLSEVVREASMRDRSPRLARSPNGGGADWSAGSDGPQSDGGLCPELEAEADHYVRELASAECPDPGLAALAGLVSGHLERDPMTLRRPEVRRHIERFIALGLVERFNPTEPVDSCGADPVFHEPPQATQENSCSRPPAPRPLAPASSSSPSTTTSSTTTTTRRTSTTRIRTTMSPRTTTRTGSSRRVGAPSATDVRLPRARAPPCA